MSEPISPKRVSILAAIAFVIAWIPVLFIPAFVLAWIARKEIREHKGTLRGEGLTTAAIVLSALTPVLLVSMDVAYRKNVHEYQRSLSNARIALQAQQTDPFLARITTREETRQLVEDIRRMESNPPSFFNPFGL